MIIKLTILGVAERVVQHMIKTVGDLVDALGGDMLYEIEPLPTEPEILKPEIEYDYPY